MDTKYSQFSYIANDSSLREYNSELFLLFPIQNYEVGYQLSTHNSFIETDENNQV